MSTAIVNVPQGSAVATREGFGEVERRQQFETSASAVAAREKAAVEARFIVALQRPRDIDTFRVRLLKECQRPGFAEDAEYARPVGRERNKITGEWEEKIARGPTIRLIETALRYFGNASAEAPVIFENSETRIVRAQLLDLESNVSWTQDIVVPRRVEKRGQKNRKGVYGPPEGREVVGERVNSEGHTTYLVIATDDEMYIRQSALVSKAQRKNAERLLPSDIIHEAVLKCRETKSSEDKRDPEAARKKLIDAFAGVNVSPSDLVEFLGGRPLDKIQPSDLDELRLIFAAIRDGEAKWTDFMEVKDPSGTVEAAAEVGRKKIEMLRQRQAEQSQPKAEPKQETPRGEQSDNSGASTDSKQAESAATPETPTEAAQQSAAAEPTATTATPKLQFGRKRN